MRMTKMNICSQLTDDLILTRLIQTFCMFCIRDIHYFYLSIEVAIRIEMNS